MLCVLIHFIFHYYVATLSKLNDHDVDDFKFLIICEKLDFTVSYAKNLWSALCTACLPNRLQPRSERYTLTVTTFAAKRLDIFHRQGCLAKISNGSIFIYVSLSCICVDHLIVLLLCTE